jgi:hypothetical protein
MSLFISKMRFLSLMLILWSSYSNGQQPNGELSKAINHLKGEFSIQIREKGILFPGLLMGTRIRMIYTSKTLRLDRISDYFGPGQEVDPTFTPILNYVVDRELEIVSAAFKSNDPTKVFVLLSDFSVRMIEIKYDIGSKLFNCTIQKQGIDPNASIISQIDGDALYILGYYKISVSRDSGKTWVIDSLNIGNLTVYGLSVDTSSYAWVATSNGVYYQHPDSSIWHKANLLPSASQGSYSIFVDRKGRIFVGMGGDIALSTDRGSSWQKISGTVSGTIDKFGDDALGNVYAINSYGSYRLSNLTLPWVRISDSLNTFNYISSSTTSINSISGDSIIYASTNYGVFGSSDQGTNWHYLSDGTQLPTYNFNSVVKSGNYFLVSTNSGIFRVVSGDTIWEKIFPAKGFQSNLSMTTDSVGNIYSVLPKQVDKFTTTYKNYKSTDHGTTWLPDTLGLSKYVTNVNSFIYNVDQQGVQYLTGTYIMYSKKPGSPWKLDTLGLNLLYVAKISSISNDNKNGVIYVTRYVFSNSSYSIYKRAYNDSLWSKVNADTLGKLSGGIISDAQGNVLVQTSTGLLFRYNGSLWTQIPLPSGLGRLGAFSVDRNGVLWTEFFDLYGQIFYGVYFSSDNGITWKYVGLNGVGVSYLVSMDDTTYAITFIDGIYGFTTASKPTSVRNKESQIASSYELFQNFPNPFNPSTKIRYSLPLLSKVSLKVYNILGQEVANLINTEQSAGFHEAVWNAKDVSSGIYFYKLTAGSFVEVRKMLVLK